jgi:hypothetical protein
MFVSLTSRTSGLLWDRTGFGFVGQTELVYVPFDVRFLNLKSLFCISLSYLQGFFARLKSVDMGIRAGYFQVLHAKGIGFKVFRSVFKHALYLFLGYNHVTKYRVPKSVLFKPLKGHVLFFSIDKAGLGSSIYHVRHLRFPDPYRGKGIRYRFQLMRFKPGKQRLEVLVGVFLRLRYTG